MSLRKCTDCGVEATNESQLELFVPRKENKYGRRNSCYKCFQNKSNVDGKRRLRQNKKNAILYNGGKCNMCGVKSGEVHDAVFDFHHLDQSEKELHVGKVMHHSWEKIRKELDKCILLCSNCHRTIHAND